ncbi:TRAP transporter small permease [Variovorax sp. OV329]|uniref:TRAP transporter small permease n=1 Tax=Variovorax sp. OV329 TaxID=1882825 RepID=UPI0008DF7E9B|nr:TRAP transporter small permease [Variovorax sp. OV329]SFM34488.1 TRAP-type C4-dicarboxylate transport system, small permease component [Variovorax sp. OV329]
MIQRLIDGICRLFVVLMVVSLGLMVVMVFGNVVLRYGFNSGITVSEELSRWMFVWMTFLGSVVALRNHAHLGTDTLIKRLPVAGRKACFVMSHLLMLFICWLMFRGAWEQTLINYGTTSAVMEASMAWFYVSGVVFAVLAALIIAHNLWKLLTGKLAESDLVTVSESEDDVPHQQQAPAAAKEQA